MSNELMSKYLHELKKLKQFRAHRYTQEQIADVLEVSRRTIVSFESGKPNLNILFAYAELLGFTVTLLITR